MSTLPKCWSKKGWIDVGSDINWEKYGGIWAKKAENKQWYFVEYYTDGWVGASLSLVDLGGKTLKQIQEALNFIGNQDSDNELEIAYALHAYGIKAPIDDFEGNRAIVDRAKAFRFAEYMMRDEKELEKKLRRKVNKIGSTATDFMDGNPLAGLKRQFNSNNPPQDNISLMLHLTGMKKE